MTEAQYGDSGSRKTSDILSLGPRIDKNKIGKTDEIVNSWQKIVDVMAEILEVPSALIMKLDEPYIEIFRASKTADNPYKEGDRVRLAGLYCEEVLRQRNKLQVQNALKDKKWADNPDVKRGMISYLGFPLFWPDGEAFGSICIFDSKKNEYGGRYEDQMLRSKELVEAHLSLLYRDYAERRNLRYVLDNLTEGIIVHDKKRRIIFFNRAAEEITGRSRENVVGKDCHVIFDGPFCGGRCSFQDGEPVFFDHRHYPVNVLTKKGDPRRIEMAVSGIKDDSGSLIGVLSSFRDVTDLVGLRIQVGDLKGFAGIIGRDPKMLQIYRQIRDLSTNDYAVHIYGETGTGKELVAAAIHNESRRGGGPFVPVNCAALPEGTLESELFGHVKGAFTGAVRDKKGRFELAHRGTLFLDEVADLPSVVQAKLLRVLQEGTFEPVGGEKTVSVDIRVLSASNRDLKREVEKNNFRDDLYYRINVVPIYLPPLRKRKKDIPLLAEHLLDSAQEEGQETPGISKEAIEIMIEYPWPGNIRELQSALRFAIMKSRGQIIQPEHLPKELRDWQSGRSSHGPSRKLDADSVRAALTRAGGNKAKSARLLGVGRATLYRFLADFPEIL